MSDYVDFSFAVSFNGKEIPGWAWRKNGLWTGRISRAAVAKLRGAIPATLALDLAFEDVRSVAKIIAATKVIGFSGDIAEPVMLELEDVG